MRYKALESESPNHVSEHVLKHNFLYFFLVVRSIVPTIKTFSLFPRKRDSIRRRYGYTNGRAGLRYRSRLPVGLCSNSEQHASVPGQRRVVPPTGMGRYEFAESQTVGLFQLGLRYLDPFLAAPADRLPFRYVFRNAHADGRPFSRRRGQYRCLKRIRSFDLHQSFLIH